MAKCSKLYFLLFFTFLFRLTFAQESWSIVYFTDKYESIYSLDRPNEFLSPDALSRRTKQNIDLTDQDLPVSRYYLDSLRSLGVEVKFPSKWFNAVLVKASDSLMNVVNVLDFVNGSEELSRKKRGGVQSNSIFNSYKSVDYGPCETQLRQLGIPEIHARGYTGYGVKIAVMDNGFLNANTIDCLDHLFEGDGISETYDFVHNEVHVYDEGTHGLAVLSVMAAFEETKLIGPAYNAQYYLYVTEDQSSETYLEMYYWLVAAERADSAGVEIINTSLGYYDFDNSDFNYSYADMDGNTTLISKAANIASDKGMLIICAAGNEGNNGWGKIVAPADAINALAIGATTGGGVKTSFSSYGPSSDGRIKPDFAVMGQGVYAANKSNDYNYVNGTSFAAPLFSAFTAVFMEAYPELTNDEIKQVLREMSSQSSKPDTLMGYGIPQGENVFAYAQAYKRIRPSLNDEILVFPNPTLANEVSIVYGKKGEELMDAIIKVYTLEGKELAHIITKRYDLGIQIKIPQIKKGMYVISLETPSNQYVKKLLKL